MDDRSSPVPDSLFTPNSRSLAPIVFTRKNEQDVVLFVGSPGSGKSTFYWEHLKPLKYERVNQDILKTVRCLNKKSYQ